MRPDLLSLVLLAALGALVLAEVPATNPVALVRLLALAVTAALVVIEEGRGSRGFFSLCAGQAVAVTAASPAAAVAGEALLLLLFAGMAGAAIVLFTVTRGLMVPAVILATTGLVILLAFPLADYRLKRDYGDGGTHEAVQ